MLPIPAGKLTSKDQRTSAVLGVAPFLALFATALPIPVVFLILFLTTATTDAAAVYLLFSFVSAGIGLVVGLVIFILLLLYRNRWHKRLRDRLAADGITGAEVKWFSSELTSDERKTWKELEAQNSLLADAYCETLATRLTATRVINRTRGEILKVERQMNRTRHLQGIDTSALINELQADRQRFEGLRQEANVRLAEAKAQLQTIEAAANRSLSQSETEVMLRRLSVAQQHSPLALELISLEREAMRDSQESAIKDPSRAL